MGYLQSEPQVLTYQVRNDGTPIIPVAPPAPQATFSYFPCTGPTKDSAWTYSPPFSTITCPGTGYTYIGPYGGLAKVTSSALAFPAHKGITVSLQVAFLDSWDAGESFNITADGSLVYSQIHAYKTQSFTNSCANPLYADAYASVTFGFNHTASTAKLVLTSTLNEQSSNEAWGVCGLIIQSTACPVLADGTATIC